MTAVILSDGVAGDDRKREVVWLVDVRHADGSTADPFGWAQVFDDEEAAEDEAVALGRRLDLPIVDERNSLLPEPGGLRPCQHDVGGRE